MQAIEFRHFTKRSGEFILNDLNFQVESGYITGLIGPNGSGKTMLIRSIMNLIKPDQGEVIVFNQSYQHREREIKRKIGFVYDEDFFYNHLTVSEMKKVVASFYPTWDESIFQRYLQDFGIAGRRKISDLSKGMKMKFALAAALAHNPELLIMDEPTSGLDPVFRKEVLSILSDYIQNEERSVLFSTHISADLERIADYIIYIRNGQLHFCGSKEELLDTYFLVKGPVHLLQKYSLPIIGLQQTALGFEGLLPRASYVEDQFNSQFLVETPSLDDILVYTQGVI
ncbi:ABC transporter ATP-binding protein [Paenibacillus sp. FSL H7-0331]|uniref:ABC transporter ATP-binding protein n=1 Tax=Paenibacillus sp. FSL H7-0331 TaxID=1920421 RepID=UPI00096D6B51|nr:ABC transporter ATP-binding protein [Paenibacillus sp. FSL H7-0331]OMF18776.1 sodium ABC transporter ATP-binding protein [Paenibacillus sp. FSL H7-0331]